MSKSIYKEALKNLNTHEHQLEFTRIFEHKFELLKKVRQALKQAQKQEKLLKLYQRLHKDVMSIVEFYDVIEQIKELENNEK